MEAGCSVAISYEEIHFPSPPPLVSFFVMVGGFKKDPLKASVQIRPWLALLNVTL
jgi:hypothetical protein